MLYLQNWQKEEYWEDQNHYVGYYKACTFKIGRRDDIEEAVSEHWLLIIFEEVNYFKSCDKGNNKHYQHRNEKGHKIVMVSNPHAVIYPGTMMVKTFYAMATRTAVTRTWSSYDFAVCTYKHWVNILYYGL